MLISRWTCERITGKIFEEKIELVLKLPIFVVQMKRCLTYLLPLFLVALFWNYKDRLISTAPDELSPLHIMSGTLSDNVISASESEFCIARQISYASPSRIQTSSRRTNSYSRISSAFAKSGKLINPRLRYFIQTKFISIHSSLIEPAQKLLYLGKLII